MKRRQGSSDDWYVSRFPPKSTPLPADGIKARTTRGQKFVNSWWADRWIAALERLVDSNRLQRGRRYARNGQVLSIELSGTGVKSKVQGSRPAPYKVAIKIAALSKGEWQKAIEVMAARAIFSAKLLAGEMPPDIESAFSSVGLSLFPDTKTDLVTECSCPDWANPCKHVSAVYYLLGERFDADPFLLFLLRGKSKDEVIADLRAMRGIVAGDHDEHEEVELATSLAASPPDEFAPLEERLEEFWAAAPTEGLKDFVVTQSTVDAAPVKQLGEPRFWEAAGDFVDTITPAYKSISDVAAALLRGDRIGAGTISRKSRNG
jgi:uncharacterized Zn finger protein